MLAGETPEEFSKREYKLFEQLDNYNDYWHNKAIQDNHLQSLKLFFSFFSFSFHEWMSDKTFKRRIRSTWRRAND